MEFENGLYKALTAISFNKTLDSEAIKNFANFANNVNLFLQKV
jgi:hypothetical protein